MNMKRFLWALPFWMVSLWGCTKVVEKENTCDCESVTFAFSVNRPGLRSASPLDVNLYDAMVYVYRQDEGSGTYVFDRSLEVTSSHFTVDALTQSTPYRFVFLAVPLSQTPALPGQLQTAQPYLDSQLDYEDPDSPSVSNDIFRAILDLTPQMVSQTVNVILTRQNGALEIRVKDMAKVQKISLRMDSYPSMFFHDGTGGQVISTGNLVGHQVEKTVDPTETGHAVSMHLLPADDLTVRNGVFTVTYTDGSSQDYPVRSDQGRIPVFPNQVTWLVLTGSDGDFSVVFGNSDDQINVDDEDWDGWL